MKRAMFKIIADWREKINPAYDMKCDEINALIRTSPHCVNLTSDAFVFGYAQGYKAAQAAAKKDK